MSEIGNKIEKEIGENTITYLQRLRKEGYLFHGSAFPEDIKSLTPKKAHDPNDKWNSDMAIYATNEPVMAVIFSLYKGKESWRTETKSNERGVKEMVAHIPLEYKDSLGNDKGFVYIMPSSRFERKSEYDPQFKSKNEVLILGRVEVNLQDYIGLGGKINWT